MSQIQSFDYSVDLLRVILWQYDGTVRLKGWIQNKQDNLDEDHTQFWNDWFTNVFNIDTINEFGVSVWAIILNLPLLINTPLVNPDKVGWGFGEFRKNFENGNFNIEGSGAQLLTIEQRRIALKMRYQYLTSNGTIPDINRILINAFGDLGVVYAADNLDMSITFKFGFPIPSWILFIFEDLQVVPVPSAVSFSLEEI